MRVIEILDKIEGKILTAKNKDAVFRSRALKCIAKKVQSPKHMQKKTICF